MENTSSSADTATVASTSAWSQSNLGSTVAQQAGPLDTLKSGLRFGASPPAVPSSGNYYYNPDVESNVDSNIDPNANANTNVHSVSPQDGVSNTAKLTQHVREQQKILEERRKQNKLKGL
eukprot:scaffold12582_cov44-Attheya_sp.AAC.1